MERNGDEGGRDMGVREGVDGGLGDMDKDKRERVKIAEPPNIPTHVCTRNRRYSLLLLSRLGNSSSS